MKPRFGVAAVVALVFASAGPLSGGCKTATQVTVDLRTVTGFPCSLLRGVDIVVASDAQTAEERLAIRSLSASVSKGQCESDGRTIGSLVVTPSGSRAAITVIARVDEGASCTKADNYKGCIIARRSFAFIEHAALSMPITLEPSCKDVPCDVNTSCRAGACADASADCSEESGDCTSPAEPGPTGGPLPGAEGGVDGASSDAPPDGSGPDAAGDGGDSGSDSGREGGVPGGQTNHCPTGGAGAEFTSAQLCCCGVTQVCVIQPNPSACPNHAFTCTGKKFCPAKCCGGGGAGMEFGFCMTDCGGGPQLCKTDADCDDGMTCGGVFYTSFAGGPIGKCVPK